MHGNIAARNAPEGINVTIRGSSGIFHSTRMQALVNGKPAELAEGTTVADLVRDLGLAERRIAVELNGEILPRSRHATQTIAADDVLEIVHAIGGGTRNNPDGAVKSDSR